MADDAEKIDEAREEFLELKDRLQKNRARYVDDIRFARLNEQWPPEWKSIRETDNRPCLTINRLPAFIFQVTNDARLNKPAINCHPVDDKADPDTAEILDGIIRNIEQTSRADQAYDHALDCAASGGFGFFRLGLEYASDDSWEKDLVIQRVMNPLSVFWDPDSDQPDSSDWNVAYVTDLVPKRTFQRRYKGAATEGWSIDEYPPEWREGDQVMVAERWTREQVKRRIVGLQPPIDGEASLPPGLLPDDMVMGVDDYMRNKALFDALGVQVIGEREVLSHQVRQQLLTGKEVLDEVEWPGRYIPIVPVWGEEVVDEHGQRQFYSLIHRAKEEQQRHNLHSSTVSELIGLQPKAPYIGPKGAFESDREKWETANSKAHAFIEFDVRDDMDQALPAAPQRQPFAGVPVGDLQAAISASDNIKAILGIYDSALGAPSNEKSGRAILARQREAEVGSFHFTDNLARAISHAGRVLVDVIPKTYPTARMLRIIGRDEKPRQVPVNQPFDEEVEAPDGQLQKVQRVYDLTTGKYDVTVKAGPSFTTRREEAQAQMVEYMQAVPSAAPVLGPELMRQWDLPNSEELAEKLEQLVGGGPAMAQAQQAIQQLQGALQAAQAENTTLKQDRMLEILKLKIDSSNAETNRLKAVTAKDFPLGPDAVNQLMPVVAQAVLQIMDSPDLLQAGAPAGGIGGPGPMGAAARPGPGLGPAPAQGF